MPFDGMPLVEYVYRRCLTAENAKITAVLTSTEHSDDPLADHCIKANIPVFRGNLDNVLHRYIEASDHYGVDHVCRVCGDSPFVDTGMIDSMFHDMAISGPDYISPAGCIDGFFSEIIRKKALKKVKELTDNSDDLEHVTQFIRNNPNIFKIKTTDITNGQYESKVSITIDTAKDLQYCRKIVSLLRKYHPQSADPFAFSSDNILTILQRIAFNTPEGENK